MIRSIFLFVVLGVGLFIGTHFSGQQGYVLISIANTTIEMSVTTLMVFIVAILAALFSLEYVIKWAFSMSTTTWNWFGARKLKRARRYTNEGIVKLLEGDWQVAEKKVTRWANHHDMPLLCYLIASEAAQEMGNNDKRDNYLALAEKQDNSTLAVQLTRVRQQVREKEFEQALSTLSELRVLYPNNSLLLNLLKTSYIQLKQWQPLLEILPHLSKAKQLDAEEEVELFQQAQCGVIIEIASSKGVKEVIAYWDHLPRKVRQDSQILVCLAKQLMNQKADSEAYTLVVESLKKKRNDELIQLIPDMNLADNYPAIAMLQKLIKQNTNDVVARSALARLLIQTEKWAEAQQQLEKALLIREDVSDYASLVVTLEKQNLTQAANNASKQALMLINTN